MLTFVSVQIYKLPFSWSIFRISCEPTENSRLISQCINWPMVLCSWLDSMSNFTILSLVPIFPALLHNILYKAFAERAAFILIH
jgi:hypothetical protein